MQNPEKNWFGEKKVQPQEKTSAVIGVFDSVADRYDIMNDVMSFGLHRLWKDRFVRMIHPRPQLKYLDVAGGTGDIAFRIKKKTSPQTDITICDLNENMLQVGQARAADKGWISGFDWTTGNAEALPFDDNSFDVYTIAFGIRNVTHIDHALAEAHRVLRTGGRFFCLEFAPVKTPIIGKLYDAYSYGLIPKLGQKIADDTESYQYLVESIRKFPTQREFLKRITQAGFQRCRYANMTAGVVSIHQGTKLR